MLAVRIYCQHWPCARCLALVPGGFDAMMPSSKFNHHWQCASSGRECGECGTGWRRGRERLGRRPLPHLILHVRPDSLTWRSKVCVGKIEGTDLRRPIVCLNGERISPSPKKTPMAATMPKGCSGSHFGTLLLQGPVN